MQREIRFSPRGTGKGQRLWTSLTSHDWAGPPGGGPHPRGRLASRANGHFMAMWTLVLAVNMSSPSSQRGPRGASE